MKKGEIDSVQCFFVTVGIQESILWCDYQHRLDTSPALFVFLHVVSVYDDYVLGSGVLHDVHVSFLTMEIDGDKNPTFGPGGVRDHRM